MIKCYKNRDLSCYIVYVDDVYALNVHYYCSHFPLNRAQFKKKHCYFPKLFLHKNVIPNIFLHKIFITL